MVAIRRFIDVIFIEPKHRQYVILHKGKFWCLPRMNLTPSAWEAKELYTGSLNDIFVSQSQLINGKLANTLNTYELPEQLAGLPATHFLAWWANNDYLWLSEKEVLKFDEKDEALPANQLLEAALRKAQFITQNPNFSDKKIELQLSQDDKPKRIAKKTDPKVGNRTATRKKQAPKTIPDIQNTAVKTNNSKATQNSSAPKNTPIKKPNKPSSTKKEDDNIFDALLEDLNNELLHKH